MTSKNIVEEGKEMLGCVWCSKTRREKQEAYCKNEAREQGSEVVRRGEVIGGR